MPVSSLPVVPGAGDRPPDWAGRRTRGVLTGPLQYTCDISDELHLRRLAALAEVAMEYPELDALLDRVLQAVVELLPVSAASLLLWDRDEEVFSTSASTLSAKRPRHVLNQVRTSGGASRWIIDNQQPLIVADVADDRFETSDLMVDAGVRSYLGVPMVFDGSSIGVLYALDHSPRGYQQVDVDFMTILSRRAASAIGFTRLLETARELATIDDLTGVWNRREFLARGRIELERAVRTGQPATAVVFDVDHFKSINDLHGHVIGDEVLRGLAQRCANEIRSIDILGRVGGEEFALLIPDVDADAALVVAERLRECIAATPITVDGEQYMVTMTLGVARSVPGEPLAALLDRADRAMYAGKAFGRNRVVADPDLHSPTDQPPATEP